MAEIALVGSEAFPPAGQRPDGAAGAAFAPDAGQRTAPSIAGQAGVPVAPAAATAPVAGQRAVETSRAERASKENVTTATRVAPRSQETISERLGRVVEIIACVLRAAGPSGWDTVSKLGRFAGSSRDISGDDPPDPRTHGGGDGLLRRELPPLPRGSGPSGCRRAHFHDRPAPVRGRGALRSRPGVGSRHAGARDLRAAAALGALLLFGAVQLTMVGRGLATGDRPTPPEWAGLFLSLGGLLLLTLPGARQGDVAGSVLMVGAGIAWGVYSLLGRSGRRDPLVSTAVHFAYAAPIAVVASLAAAPWRPPHLSVPGLGLAVASGALASGGGYAIWYTALRGLSTTQSALVQLSVPPLAALGSVLFLGEVVTLRLALSALAIPGGIVLAAMSRRA